MTTPPTVTAMTNGEIMMGWWLFLYHFAKEGLKTHLLPIIILFCLFFSNLFLIRCLLFLFFFFFHIHNTRNYYALLPYKVVRSGDVAFWLYWGQKRRGIQYYDFWILWVPSEGQNICMCVWGGNNFSSLPFPKCAFQWYPDSPQWTK